MKDVALRDQIMNSLDFEVEAVPQEDDQISSASNNGPINVKIRIRKKNRKQSINRRVISIPKIGRQMYKNEKIRLTNSDQTIMSFNVLMEREESVIRPLPKQKRFFQLFKRGGCLGIQNDEDQYEYSIESSKNINKNHKLSEALKKTSSDTLETTNFTLTKNYRNLDATHENKQEHKDFLGKCKPGGCLDPPFGEEKYPYLPKLIDMSVTKQNEIKIKNIECEYDETFTNNNNLKSNKKDTMSNIALIKKEKTESLYASDISLKYLKESNSIITFPSISTSIEALNKHIHKRAKSYSSSKESESYNVPYQSLETYYISPRIKSANKTSKSISGSATEITHTVSVLQNEEFLLNEAALETLNLNDISDKLITNIQPNPCINESVPLELNDGSKNNEEVITNYAIESDELRAESIILNSIPSPAILKKQGSNMEIELIACTEKKSVADINVIPELILSSAQNVRSSMKLIKLGEEQGPNLEINKLKELKADTNTKDQAEPQSLHNYKNYETVVKSHDHSFHTERLNVKYSSTEDHSQHSEYSIKDISYDTNNIDNIITTNEGNGKNVVTSHDDKSIDKYSENKKTASEINLQEKEQLVTKVIRITSKTSNADTNFKKNIETIVTLPQDLIFNNKEFPAKDIIQERKETLIATEGSFKKTNSTEIINALPDDHMLNDYDLKIINTTDKFPSEEQDQAIVETLINPLESYIAKNKNNIKTVSTIPQYLTVSSKDSNIINVSEELPSKENGQVTVETVTKSVDSFITKNKNDIETVSVSPHYLTVSNKNSNIINVDAELPLKEIDHVKIETAIKSIESLVIKNKKSIEKVSPLSQHLIIDTKDLKTINVAGAFPSKDQLTIDIPAKSEKNATTNVKSIVEVLIEGLLDLIVNDENPKILNMAEKVASKEMEATTQYLTKSRESSPPNINYSTDKIIKPTQDHLFSNEELKLKYVALKTHDSTKEQIDVSNMSIKSMANSTSMTVPQKELSFKDESKDFKITDEIEINLLESNQPLLIMSSTKNTDDIETVKSLQNKGSLTIIETAQMKHIDEGTTSDNKILEREENIIQPYTKTNAVSLISTKDSKIEKKSNSILNWEFEHKSNQSKETKSEEQSFHTDRNNLVATDVVEQLNNQDSPVIATISNIEEVNKLHKDINSLFSNIVDDGSSTTKKQEIEVPIKSKNKILESNIYLKHEDGILGDKNFKNGKLMPSSLSKSTYKIGAPTRNNLNLSNKRNRYSKGSLTKNIHYTGTILSNNISANTKENRKLKHHIPLKNYNEKELINLNMAFQSFYTDNGESFVNTLDSSSFNNAKRYPNDNILQFKTVLRPNEGEIKIPIDAHKYLVVHITTDSKTADNGNSFRSLHPATKDFQTVTKSAKDRATISESNLQQTLDKVYKDKLLPLHDVIKNLNNDIEQLSKQQALIQDKIHKTNVVQPNRIQKTGNKCGCIEMFVRR